LTPHRYAALRSLATSAQNRSCMTSAQRSQSLARHSAPLARARVQNEQKENHKTQNNHVNKKSWISDRRSRLARLVSWSNEAAAHPCPWRARGSARSALSASHLRNGAMAASVAAQHLALSAASTVLASLPALKGVPAMIVRNGVPFVYMPVGIGAEGMTYFLLGQ